MYTNVFCFFCRYTEFEKLKLSMKYHGTKLRRNVRLSLFIFFGTVLTISVVMIAYILALSKILYNSLLVFRGINADLDVKVFYEKLNEVASVLHDQLHLTWLGDMIYPFIRFLEWVGGFSIDLGAVEVTCIGSQAPMELLINCLILGFVVLVIESKFSVYTSNLFGDINMKIAKTIFHFKLKGVNRKKILAVICLLISLMTHFDPLTKTIQFTMSLLTFSAFVKKNGMVCINTIYLYIHTYIHTCIHTYMHIYMFICVHIYFRKFICSYI